MSLQEHKMGVVLRKQNKVRPRRDKDGFAKVEDLRFPYNKIRPPRTQKGGWRFAIKIQCVLGGTKHYINKGGASKTEDTHRGFRQYYTGPSPIHSKITTNSSSSNIVRSNSSMTLRTATSIISSARFRRYASNLGPAINDGFH